jgi:DNA-binding NtrC family response regulator
MFNPPQSVQIQSSPQSANEHIISNDDDNDLAIIYDCVMSQKSETKVVSLIQGYLEAIVMTSQNSVKAAHHAAQGGGLIVLTISLPDTYTKL